MKEEGKSDDDWTEIVEGKWVIMNCNAKAEVSASIITLWDEA
jgi:hypothetical protein